MSELASEKRLLDAAVVGDAAALEQFLLSHFQALERHIKIPPDARRHLDAEDILQEVLAQAFRDIKQFKHRDGSSIIAWLKTIADHRLADALKRIGRKKRGGNQRRLTSADFAKKGSVVALFDIVCHDSHVPQDSVARREMERAMHVSLASLPENQRVVLVARYIEGKDVNEIARDTGRTEGAVRGLIQRGKENLAESMGRASQWLSSR